MLLVSEGSVRDRPSVGVGWELICIEKATLHEYKNKPLYIRRLYYLFIQTMGVEYTRYGVLR